MSAIQMQEMMPIDNSLADTLEEMARTQTGQQVHSPALSLTYILPRRGANSLSGHLEQSVAEGAVRASRATSMPAFPVVRMEG